MRFSEGGFESFFSGGNCIGTLWSLDISERYSLFSEGGKKKWSLSGGEGEMCVDTFGLFLLGDKSNPTSSMGGGGGGY